MIDNNYLRSFCLRTHLADVAIREIAAFAPCALVTIGTNLAADISGKLEVKRFKIARKSRVRVISNIEQARKFTETSGVTGIVLTKLDGTAKGGIVVAIARELNLPIRYIGVGEKAEDLLPFDSEKFIESLFEK